MFYKARSSKTGRPELRRRLPRLLSGEEVARLIESPPGEGALRLRNAALLEVLYATGCRSGEVRTLRLSRVFADRLHVTSTKTGKDRIVFLTTRAQVALCAYIERARPVLAKPNRPSPAVFLSRLGGALHASTLWRMLKDAARLAGIDPELVWPHVIRHAFATHVLEGGANLRAVQELLGHENLSTTQIYTHVEVSRFREAHQQFHPRGG